MPSQPSTFLPTDIVILVTGLVGSGRSTFINALLQSSSHRMTVGDSLSTCTTKVECAVVDLSGHPQCARDYRLVLVDTPGFNDGSKPDSAVLEDIASWVQRSFPEGRCRGGVIYLHDISADRTQCSAEADLRELDAAFNSSSSKQLIIATTKWNCINNSEGDRRQALLRNRWKGLAAASTMQKFKGTEHDAWNIIGGFLPQIEIANPIDLRKEFSGIKDKMERGESKRDVRFRALARLFSRFLVNA